MNEKISIGDIIDRINSHKTINSLFEQNPGLHLVKYCHQRANQVREIVQEREQLYNIKFWRDYAIKHNDQVRSALVNETIQMIDAIEEEKRYLAEKFLMNENLINQ